MVACCLCRNNENDSVAKMKAAQEALEAKEKVSFSLAIAFCHNAKIMVCFLVICANLPLLT